MCIIQDWFHSVTTRPVESINLQNFGATSIRMLDVFRWKCEINMTMKLRRHRLEGTGSVSWAF
jgi:hypothetical protein